MKTKLFFIITFLSFSLLSAQSVGDTFVIEGLTYKITELGTSNTVEVSNDGTVSGSVTIPSTVVDGVTYDVTAIGKSAFQANVNITEVILPSSVTHIKESAFHGCTILASANLENLVQIDKRGFRECQVLVPTDTNLANLTTTGPSAFDRCNGFKSLNLPVLTSVSDYSFVKCTNMTYVTLSPSLTDIPLGMFDENTSLESITIPSKVTTIGKWAFRNAGFKTVTSLNPTPPTVDANAFLSSGYTTIPLLVPSGAETAYGSAAVWEDFASLDVLSVSNVKQNLNFNVYPNPVNDVIFIKGEDVDNANISVYDFRGKMLLSSNITEISPEVNISTLATGVYFLKIKTQTGEFTKKIVKK
ncbi:leucine-rich repeat domain-containing protein [Polaribacter sp. Hel1_85]|uniref:leucine-rich repeat domain-containing protein n=1 Tax=Polaribacter sp. Hel1_85 TaxID=1250005 RepID=UPI00052B5ED3|nr:leucine-rich repeat domain-containing protein [Polaribacter sp. Hel1_85]KGL62296.1 cell surface leucine-rich repeat protein-containing protein [Polaribacter sp. Hel1_85]